MLRKITAIAAMVTVVASAACNSVTAPQAVDESSSSGRPIRPRADVGEKVCLDDLRAVEITSPGESQQLHGGELVMVTWDTQEICGAYESAVRVSYDGGQTFHSLGITKNARSMGWRLPELDGVPALVEVVVTDRYGSVSDRLALASPVTTIRRGGDRFPDQHD